MPCAPPGEGENGPRAEARSPGRASTAWSRANAIPCPACGHPCEESRHAPFPLASKPPNPKPRLNPNLRSNQRPLRSTHPVDAPLGESVDHGAPPNPQLRPSPNLVAPRLPGPHPVDAPLGERVDHGARLHLGRVRDLGGADGHPRHKHAVGVVTDLGGRGQGGGGERVIGRLHAPTAAERVRLPRALNQHLDSGVELTYTHAHISTHTARHTHTATRTWL